MDADQRKATERKLQDLFSDTPCRGYEDIRAYFTELDSVVFHPKWHIG